jgi:hypothetical protein
MVNKSIILGICMFISINLVGQHSNLIFNSSFNQHLNEVKKIVARYIKEYDDLNDYMLIMNVLDDTIQLYVSTFSSKSSVGHLEPFGWYEMDGKKIYLFIKQGVRWKRDNSFSLNKSEVTIDDYPIWLITITSESFALEKGVRGLFAPPSPPRGYNVKYKPPVIDSTIQKK